MIDLSQLEVCTNDLVIATNVLATNCRETGNGANTRLVLPLETSDEVQRARRRVLGLVSRLQKLLAEPVDFIQHLASQVCGHLNHNTRAHLTVWVESIACMFKMARGIPGSCLYSSEW